MGCSREQLAYLKQASIEGQKAWAKYRITGGTEKRYVYSSGCTNRPDFIAMMPENGSIYFPLVHIDSIISAGIELDLSSKQAEEEPAPSPSALNLRELLSGDINRLRYIQRYSTSLVVHKENVAEHSYYVALYALFIIESLSDDETPVFNFGDVLARCLLHDLEETATGDIQRPIKHAIDQESLDNVSANWLRGTLSRVSTDVDSTRAFMALWQRAKDDILAGAIVSLADFLSVLSYLMMECKFMNPTIVPFYASILEYSNQFNSAKYDALRDIVNQAQAITQEICK